MLMDLGFVVPDQVAQARQEAQASGVGVVDYMVANKMIRAEDVTQAKAAHFGAEVVHLSGMKIEDDVIATVRRDIAKKYRVIPVFKHENTLTVALADPSDIATVDALTHLLKMDSVVVQVASEADIEAALSKYYGGRGDSALDNMIQEITRGEVEIAGAPTADIATGGDALTVDGDAPLIKLVNQIIIDAFKMRASDIHLEPLSKRFRLRYRIDGMMHEVKSPPKRLQPAIIARLKIQSNMSIAEHRIPQDGRIQTTVGGGKLIDLRVSCLPTNHGESIVMRILDKDGLRVGLAELGFLSDDQQVIEKLISLPDGLFLVTGPTGSGKTTTLYSCLHFINRPDRKIITVEDPVEYVLAGINQVQVSEAVGLSFSGALRSILRQAPNIIMIGEIRDMETASIAINASLTGHLVFSTLHTNDAPGAVTRLIDIGVKPFLVASSTRALLAQRLVRKICKKCGAPWTPPDNELKALGIDSAMSAGATYKKGKGCDNCSGTGCRGRMGIFEIFVIDDDARKLIYDKVPTSVLRARAREMGMRTLREDGVRKVLGGMTTPDEVIRATVGDDT